jgi:hypothetical protein
LQVAVVEVALHLAVALDKLRQVVSQVEEQVLVLVAQTAVEVEVRNQVQLELQPLMVALVHRVHMVLVAEVFSQMEERIAVAVLP